MAGAAQSHRDYPRDLLHAMKRTLSVKDDAPSLSQRSCRAPASDSGTRFIPPTDSGRIDILQCEHRSDGTTSSISTGTGEIIPHPV